MKQPHPDNPYSGGPQYGGPPHGPQPQGPSPYDVQPGYAYPPPGPGMPYGPGGYPVVAPFTMPGTLKASRVFLFVIAGVQTIWCLIAIFVLIPGLDDTRDTATATSDEELEFIADVGQGMIVALVVLTLIAVGLGIWLGVSYANGGNAVRVCSIVYGSLGILGGLVTAAIGLITSVLCILLVIFCAQHSAAEWFRRPRPGPGMPGQGMPGYPGY